MATENSLPTLDNVLENLNESQTFRETRPEATEKIVDSNGNTIGDPTTLLSADVLETISDLPVDSVASRTADSTLPAELELQRHVHSGMPSGQANLNANLNVSTSAASKIPGQWVPLDKANSAPTLIKSKDRTTASDPFYRLKKAIRKRDTSTLRMLAKTQGIPAEYRKSVWSLLLLGVEDVSTLDPLQSPSAQFDKLTAHPEESQVELDTARAFVYYPENISDIDKMLLKKKLHKLVVSVLRRNPDVCYYQGYHEVAQVILLVVQQDSSVDSDNEIFDLSVLLLEHLTLYWLRDFMVPNLEPTFDQLRLIPPMIKALDADMFAHLEGIEPFYAVSAILTLFVHDMRSLEDSSRVFDFVIAHNNMAVPLYLFAVFAVSALEHNRQVIEEPDMIHSVLSTLPGDSTVPIAETLNTALKLISTLPLESIGSAWDDISPHSVLKTTASGEMLENELEYDDTIDVDESMVRPDNSQLITDLFASQVKESIAEHEARQRKRAQESPLKDNTDSQNGFDFSKEIEIAVNMIQRPSTQLCIAITCVAAAWVYTTLYEVR